MIDVDDLLNEPRDTFKVRRAMLFGAGVAAVKSILPDTARAEAPPIETTDGDNPSLYLEEETEPQIAPIKDFTLVKNHLTGEVDAIELDMLANPEALIFASCVRQLDFAYSQENFQVKSGCGSCVVADHLNLGANYSLSSVYTSNHAFDKMSPAAYPDIRILGSNTFGYAMPNRGADDISEDVAELLLASDSDVFDESGNSQYTKPVIHMYGKGETFSDLARKIVKDGKKLYLTGFPTALRTEGQFSRTTFEVRLMDIVTYEDEDVKYVFEFLPTGINSGLPAKILPGCSGGALGYVEDGVPHIIGIQHGYDSKNWLGVSLNTTYGTDFIAGAGQSIEDIYKQPTAFGIEEVNKDIKRISEVADMTDLAWYLLKNSNYPIDDIDKMLWFQENLRIYNLALDEVRVLNKCPLLMVKDESGNTKSFLWDKKEKMFLDFSG